MTRRVDGSSLRPAISTAESSASGALRRSTARMRASSSCVENGLVRESSAPASRPETLSASSERAVSITMGSSRVRGSLRQRRASAMPDWPGSIQSRITRSGSMRSTSRCAWSAVAAMVTS